MSIEVEIQKARDRKPTPVWEALDRLDKIAAFARLGLGHIRPYPEDWEPIGVAQPEPKAQPCPPIVVAADSDIDKQLSYRSSAWDAAKPIAVEKPKTYVGLTPAQTAKEKFEQVKRELAAKIAARREAAHG